jgi:hypothetical protein
MDELEPFTHYHVNRLWFSSNQLSCLCTFASLFPTKKKKSPLQALGGKDKFFIFSSSSLFRN